LNKYFSRDVKSAFCFLYKSFANSIPPIIDLNPPDTYPNCNFKYAATE